MGPTVRQSLPSAVDANASGRHAPQASPGLRSSHVPIPVESHRVSPPQRLRFVRSWQFWTISTVVAFTGVGAISLALLLKIPALPNCPTIFWPTASASLRLYCAQVAANKETVDDLLRAIALVDSLPADHPLRPEINRSIEEWSLEILRLAAETFNAGDLSEAIAMAQKIPTSTPAYQEVGATTQRWREIWAEAEFIFQESEAAMRQQDLRQAFAVAVRLLSVGNTYWETVKYQELNDLITMAREDGNTLSRARGLANRGGLSNLLAAVRLVEGIKPESYAYAEADKLLQELGQDMLDLAQAAAERQDVQAAIAIVRQIPARAKMEAEGQDFINLAYAQAQAVNGTVPDLEAAIVQAQRLQRDRPLYGRAQQLISRWQLEIQDVMRLGVARQLAQAGTVGDLAAAISEARLIPAGNPRGDEAQADIDRWTSQIETIEDRPYLDQAEQIARNRDVASLQAAIDIASRIGSGRALSEEANSLIQDWTGRIQRIQDQPQLDRARQLASLGNLSAAIAAAEQIQSGRVLYDTAQADIRTWRDQVQGQDRMQQAYQSAGMGTATALVSAIRAADQVAANSSSRPEAERMINIWSQEILRLAQEQAGYDLAGAIATAERIPPRTEAYAAAQLQIESWRQVLTPVPPTP